MSLSARPFMGLVSTWSLVLAMALGVVLFAVTSERASADDPQLQTVTFLGGKFGPGEGIGSIDSTTEYTQDGGATWQPAYLVGGHPWGLVPGTDSWINCAPTSAGCLNQTVTYRVRFAVPDGWSSPTMAFEIKADNAGTVFLNGTQITPRFVSGGSTPPLALDTTLQTGINEMLIVVEDWGGLAGFNYRADISMIAPSPITQIPAGTEPTDTDGDGVPDDLDAFPSDPTEWADTDGDGIGDNSDPDPLNAGPVDSDGDGVADDEDAFPDDPTEWADSDGDGVGDNGDAFPNDPTEWADADGDGVGDNGDAFPNSDLSATVAVNGCDSGVANQLLSDGATMNDLIAAATAAAANHGAVVSAVSSLTNEWKDDGLISGREKGQIVSCIARSDAGKKSR